MSKSSYRRKCKTCGTWITMIQMPAGQWVAFEERSKPHKCTGKRKKAESSFSYRPPRPSKAAPKVEEDDFDDIEFEDIDIPDIGVDTGVRQLPVTEIALDDAKIMELTDFDFQSEGVAGPGIEPLFEQILLPDTPSGKVKDDIVVREKPERDYSSRTSSRPNRYESKSLPKAEPTRETVEKRSNAAGPEPQKSTANAKATSRSLDSAPNSLRPDHAASPIREKRKDDQNFSNCFAFVLVVLVIGSYLIGQSKNRASEDFEVPGVAAQRTEIPPAAEETTLSTTEVYAPSTSGLGNTTEIEPESRSVELQTTGRFIEGVVYDDKTALLSYVCEPDQNVQSFNFRKSYSQADEVAFTVGYLSNIVYSDDEPPTIIRIESQPDVAPTSRENPLVFLMRYYEFLEDDDFAAAYDMRSSRSHRTTDYEDFVKTWRPCLSIVTFDHEVRSIDDELAVVALKLMTNEADGNTLYFDVKVRLVYEDGWKYDGFIEQKALPLP